MRCDCVQGPELIQTGRSLPDANWVCPVCKEEFYKLDGKFSKEKPAKKQINVMGNSGGK